jgi:hypothetical protein
MPTDTIPRIVADLAALPAADDLFNPYADDDPAAAIRRANLTRHLTALLERGTPYLMVAEAPGYRGCRWTGIPVMSERIMLQGIAKWDLLGAGYQPTSDVPEGVAEATPTILWGAVIEYLDHPPLLWNALPLHPHKKGNRDSNRPPRAAELAMGEPFIQRVIALYAPELIFAVGRKAERSLSALGVDHVALRHPSQGGKADFIAGLRSAVGR